MSNENVIQYKMQKRARETLSVFYLPRFCLLGVGKGVAHGRIAVCRDAGCVGKVDRVEGLSHMSEFAAGFYNSPEWKKCREAYRQSVGGLCERCMKRGLIVPGDAVHHKTRLTPDNLNDPSITLSFDNLELLCVNCHAEEHRKHKRRYTIDEHGRVSCRD